MRFIIVYLLMGYYANFLLKTKAFQMKRLR